jgi:uncharacterized membrane protein
MKETHIHLLINHMPIFGFLFGAIVLAIGIWSKSTTAKLAAYVVLLISAVGGAVAYLTGEAAEKTVKHIPGIAEKVIEQHETAAGYALVVIIVIGIMAVLAAVLSVLHPSTTNVVAWCTLLISLVGFGLVAKTGYLGGQIRHTEVNGYTVPDDDYENHDEYD